MTGIDDKFKWWVFWPDEHLPNGCRLNNRAKTDDQFGNKSGRPKKQSRMDKTVIQPLRGLVSIAQ